MFLLPLIQAIANNTATLGTAVEVRKVFVFGVLIGDHVDPILPLHNRLLGHQVQSPGVLLSVILFV
jgi:hypothetical protein